MIDPRCLRRSNPSPRRPKALRGRSNRVRNLPARMAPTRLRLSSMRMELAPPAPRRSNPNPRGRQASLKLRSSRPKTPESRSNGIWSFQRPMLPTPRPLRLHLRRKDLSPLRPSSRRPTPTRSQGRLRSRILPSAPRRAILRRRRLSAPPRFTSCATRRPPPRPTSFRSDRARLIRWPGKPRQAFPPRAWSSATASATRSAKSRALWSAARRLRATIPRTNGRARIPGGKFKTIQAQSSRRTGEATLGRRAAPTTMRFGATPARFWTVSRLALSSPATGRRSTPIGRCSSSLAIVISQNFRRRMPSPECSATAIRKR